MLPSIIIISVVTFQKPFISKFYRREDKNSNTHSLFNIFAKITSVLDWNMFDQLLSDKNVWLNASELNIWKWLYSISEDIDASYLVILHFLFSTMSIHIVRQILIFCGLDEFQLISCVGHLHNKIQIRILDHHHQAFRTSKNDFRRKVCKPRTRTHSHTPPLLFASVHSCSAPHS